VFNLVCRCLGHDSDSFEGLEWIPSISAAADRLEKVVEHYRCNRCGSSWVEVIFDAQAIEAELKRIETEIDAAGSQDCFINTRRRAVKVSKRIRCISQHII